MVQGNYQIFVPGIVNPEIKIVTINFRSFEQSSSNQQGNI